MNLFKRGRKIPFENVVKNLRRGKYNQICSDYANGGITLFLEDLFADNLGLSKEKLFKIGLLKKEDQNGWNLTKTPKYQDLIILKTSLLFAGLTKK